MIKTQLTYVQIINKYDLTINEENNLITIDFALIKTPKRSEFIDHILYLINTSSYNIEIKNYNVISKTEKLVINVQNRKLNIINCIGNIQVIDCENVDISDSTLDTVQLNKTVNNINIDNTIIGKLCINPILKERISIILPDIFSFKFGNGMRGELKSIFFLCFIILLEFVFAYLFKFVNLYTMSIVSCCVFVSLILLKWANITKESKLIRETVLWSNYVILYYGSLTILKVILDINNIPFPSDVNMGDLLIEWSKIITVFWLLLSIGIWLLYISIKSHRKSPKYYFFNFTKTCVLHIAIDIGIALYKYNRFSVTLYLLITCIFIVFYSFIVKKLFIEENNRVIILNSTVKETAINFEIENIEEIETSNYYIKDFYYIKTNEINKVSLYVNENLLNINELDNENKKRKEIIVNILKEHNFYVNDMFYNELCKNLLLENKDVYFLKSIDKSKNNYYLNGSYKSNFKYLLFKVQYAFLILLKYGNFTLKVPLYIFSIMLLLGAIVLFQDKNMTITDNYIASNIALKNYEKYCLNNECFELAKPSLIEIENYNKLKDKNNINDTKQIYFKIPKVYGEYNPFIYTIGLFLPLENNQTKSFKPNEKTIEIWELLYRLFGYFIWIMVFSKIKYLFGTK